MRMQSEFECASENANMWKNSGAAIKIAEIKANK